jgi:glycosyltransferase involved in cell wall biosynthesis
MSETVVPRLSAILPNYNHGNTIGEAIAALASQAPAPDEIIVVDDGSTDDSVGIIRNLSRHVPNLRLVALPRNVGAIGALNRGLQEARGEFVYFGAADDLTLPGLFAALLPLLEASPDIAFASAEGLVSDSETGETNPRPPVRPADSAAIFTPADVARIFKRIDNWILTGAALIRRDMMLRDGGLDASLGAFADGYALRGLAFAHGCAFVPHTGLIWRISASGVSRSQAADPTKSLAVLTNALDRMGKDSAFPDWYPALFARRWRFGIGRLAADAVPMNREVLECVAARGIPGRFFLGFAATIGGPVGRFLAKSWLTLRERPTSIIGLVQTVIARRRVGH